MTRLFILAALLVQYTPSFAAIAEKAYDLERLQADVFMYENHWDAEAEADLKNLCSEIEKTEISPYIDVIAKGQKRIDFEAFTKFCLVTPREYIQIGADHGFSYSSQKLMLVKAKAYLQSHLSKKN